MRERIGKIGALVVLGIFAALMLSPSAVAVDYNLNDITMYDGEWIGLDPGGRIIFHNQATDEIEVADARLGIGDTSPDFKLEVTGSSGYGYFGVSSSSDGDIFVIDSNGKVGIGKTAPVRKLDILDASNPQLRLSVADATYTDFQTTSDGHLYINPSGGNVGIGTSKPGAKLDVEVSYGSGGAAELGDNWCSALGDCAVAIGSATEAYGDSSFAQGFESNASSACAVAMGTSSTASGPMSFAMGGWADASGIASSAIGWYATASGDPSYATGIFVTASGDACFVLGRGTTLGEHLVNNIDNSLMIGFESTTPTLFVDSNSVGIGGITSPGTTLHVDGDVAFDDGADLTISSGTITVTHSYHDTINAESSNSDELTKIIGGNAAGQILIIRAASGDTITVKDGSGNLILSGDFEMDSTDDTLMLIYDGTYNWLEISRRNNG